VELIHLDVDSRLKGQAVLALGNVIFDIETLNEGFVMQIYVWLIGFLESHTPGLLENVVYCSKNLIQKNFLKDYENQRLCNKLFKALFGDCLMSTQEMIFESILSVVE